MNLALMQATLDETRKQTDAQRAATAKERDELLAAVDRTFETVGKEIQQLRMIIESSYQAQLDADTLMLWGSRHSNTDTAGSGGNV